jgi:hypothetical protein
MAKRDVTKDLENALNEVQSEKAREQVLLKLIEKHDGKIKIPETYVDVAVQYCDQVAEQKSKQSNPHNLIEWLEVTLNFARAVGRANKMQQIYATLSEKYEAVGALAEAAQDAGLSGNAERANQLYEQQFRIYEENSKFSEAAKLARQAGFPERVKAYQTLDRLLKK